MEQRKKPGVQYASEELATKAVKDCNNKLTSPTAPDYYVQAVYVGDLDKLPNDYKI
jgi:hypothetical protein